MNFPIDAQAIACGPNYRAGAPFMSLAVAMNRFRTHLPRHTAKALLFAALCPSLPAGLMPNALAVATMDAGTQAAPQPIAGLVTRYDGGFVIELAWDAVDMHANGIVIERCWPQGAKSVCELAAALHPDAVALEYHAIQPWRFRVASFNEHGVSPFSPLSPVVGAEHVIDASDPAPLSAADSILARRIVDGAGDPWRCTSPQALIDEGLALLAVREDVDLYRGPAGECGTGGCPYSSYTVTAGCYHVHEADLGLYSQPPYSGRRADAGDGLRMSNSSGRACEGHMTLFRNDVEVDAYAWFSCYDEHLPNLRVPFNPLNLQRPDVPR
ncbi:hypothetical protein [Dokdonella sp.]|uniref:hypothetical protein n=1 Tax=Dokdonella sp. TaxID=2291710 RepID=UPI0035294A68